jgi:hypothetical protein
MDGAATADASTRVVIVIPTGAHAGIAAIVAIAVIVLRVAITAAAAVEAVTAIGRGAVSRIDVSVRPNVVVKPIFAARVRGVGAREIAAMPIAAAMPTGRTQTGRMPIGPRVTSTAPKM